VSLLDAKVQ
jgi:hypothetical protein